MNQQSADFPTIVTRFGYSPLTPALWRDDRQTSLKYRDLSLDEASEGVLTGQHFRAAGKILTTDALTGPESYFVFLFVLAGHVWMEEVGQEAVRLKPLDSATRHGSGRPAILRFSQDAEIILLRATERPVEPFGSGVASWTFSHETEKAYVRGDGPREYFLYRDLQVAAATERRIHIHLVRSTKAVQGGTGWHAHSMGQLFYVLRGWAELEVERQPYVRMGIGDAMCIAKGMKHNVPAFSDDYLVLEMCIPADYDTFGQTLE